ncbi:MAG TPA: hypothetical protein VKA46_26575 [Gemmataceae bacterium]|nr:hypothetical protein [Gemmataceae bacterium]
MRFNDIGLLIIVLLLGVLLGVIGTAGVYHSVAARQAEAERQESEEALKRAQEERDEALGRIDEYLAAERTSSVTAEQPSGLEPRPRPAPAAAPQRPPVAAAPRPAEGPAPKEREVTAPPREDAKNAPPAVSGFGPPRHIGE